MNKKVYLKTWGWPMGAVLYDYCALSEQDLVNRIDSQRRTTMEKITQALITLR